MKHSLFLSSALVLLLNAVSFAQAPAGGNDARLREALREASNQLRTAQAELATLKAEQASLLQERDEAQAKLGAAQKQLGAEVATQEKNIKALKAQTTEQAAELETLRKEVKETHAQLQTAEQSLQVLTGEKNALAITVGKNEGKITELRAKNLNLYFLSKEILQRYEKHSLGKAIAAKEPFIGRSRAGLETLIQETQDKIDDNLAKQ